jgi:RimJ/RimL family protein N-acetyltransferase
VVPQPTLDPFESWTDLKRGDVCLRPFREDDRAALDLASRDPRLQRYSFAETSPTDADRQAWLQRLLGPWTRHTAHLAISGRTHGEIAGGISVHLNRSYNSAEAGYWVSPDRRGHHLAATALAMVADWLFDVVHLGRLAVLINLDNTNSIAVARRCGFTLEGTPRGYMPIRGERPDLLSWSLLPGDPRPWLQARST